MLFNSLAFAIFMPVVFVLYWFVPHKYRWELLLAASYFFYMSWNPQYAILIIITTVVSFLCGKGIEQHRIHKKGILAFGVIIELGILFVFKYVGFTMNTVIDIATLFGITIPYNVTLNLILPVGISFYTFQTMSYIIDIYRGRVSAENHFGIYALYVSFFPQLVAGPIERPENLLPQFRKEKYFDYDSTVYGLLLIVWGLFEKIAIADALAVFVDKTFAELYTRGPLTVLISIIFFTLQIYCDFCGYSTMAVGVAKVLGFDLMSNFRSPYLAPTVKEFWRRWHISLTSWFTDYIYIPLGGSRVGKLKHYRNIMITFLLSGLWHGADWTYIIWGGIHGIYLITGDLTRKVRNGIKDGIHINKSFYQCMGRIITFCLVGFAWIFFRSNTLQEAWMIIEKLGSANMENLKTDLNILSMDRSTFVSLIPPLGLLFCYDFFSQKTDVLYYIHSKLGALPRWCIYIIFTIFLVLFSVKDTAEVFIYFQF